MHICLLAVDHKQVKAALPQQGPGNLYNLKLGRLQEEELQQTQVADSNLGSPHKSLSIEGGR